MPKMERMDSAESSGTCEGKANGALRTIEGVSRAMDEQEAEAGGRHKQPDTYDTTDGEERKVGLTSYILYTCPCRCSLTTMTFV